MQRTTAAVDVGGAPWNPRSSPRARRHSTRPSKASCRPGNTRSRSPTKPDSPSPLDGQECIVENSSRPSGRDARGAPTRCEPERSVLPGVDWRARARSANWSSRSPRKTLPGAASDFPSAWSSSATRSPHRPFAACSCVVVPGKAPAETRAEPRPRPGEHPPRPQKMAANARAPSRELKRSRSVAGKPLSLAACRPPRRGTGHPTSR